MKKIFLTAALVLVTISMSVNAAIETVHIANGAQSILSTTVTMDIDPAVTTWVAWNDITVPHIRNNKEYVGSYSWIAVDDYFNLTVTNPLGVSSTVRMDYNDAWAVSSGPQAVIFGTAEDAPDVARWGANWSPTSAGRSNNPKIFNEAGAFNSLFTTSGTYTFRFLSGNTGANVVAYPNMYLLANVVPEPCTLLLIGIGGLAISLKKRS